jgi:hypothetical protein
MTTLTHELWVDPEGLDTFCLAGPMGDEARSLLPAGSKLVWTVDAGSHFEAMTKYYKHIGLGEYKSDHAWDFEPYPDDWHKNVGQ